ncbi:MAG: ATP-binding protein, partial [Verrucomicrobiota bacterium]
AGVPEQIAGDERRIRQILINLLGNAIKFTSDGSVSLRVTRSGESLDFSVEDTGLGISSEALARLFHLFTQADSTIHQKYGGTGIGLAVSGRLAEAMGGTISVVSTPGKGSTFTFRFPLEVSAGGMASVPPVGKNGPVEKSGGRCAVSADFSDPKNGTARSPSLQGTTGRDALPVLIVEDDRSNSFVVGKMLQSLGYRVEFAANGAEAVEAFARGKYLAILMDLRMPVMDGFEAVAIIRSRESGSRVPIIALSANVLPGSREIYLAAGMDDFLSKPFKKAELAAILASVAQR